MKSHTLPRATNNSLQCIILYTDQNASVCIDGHIRDPPSIDFENSEALRARKRIINCHNPNGNAIDPRQMAIIHPTQRVHTGAKLPCFQAVLTSTEPSIASASPWRSLRVICVPKVLREPA